MQEHQTNDVTNPIQAASEIFYRPKAVFNAIANVNNWSWVPFIIVCVIGFLPTYLYYGLVDLDWLVHQMALTDNPNASPAEIENFKSAMPKAVLSYTAFAIPVVLVIVNAIIAGYYTLVTKNDEKNVQGFMDWFGASWWIAMPSVVNGLIACILLALQEPNTQISTAIATPLSVAFMLGTDMTSQWFGFFSGIRLDTFWSILIAGYCINSWTSFSFEKSLILSAIPALVIWSISFLVAI